MSWKAKSSVAILAGLLVLSAVPCRADHYVDLPCWAPYGTLVPGTIRSSHVNWASPVIDETSVGSGTETQSFGLELPYDTWEYSELQCTLILPETYDDAGNTPQVTIMGWAIDRALCAELPPTLPPATITVDVSSRAYSAGDLANAAWSSPTSSTIVSADCFFVTADKVASATVNAASSAGSWSAGDLVFFRIRRVPAGTYYHTFHVSRVRLRLPD